MRKRTEHNLIVCTSKSEAEVTNNKSLHSRYSTVEANYRQAQSIAEPLCNSRTSSQTLKTCTCFIQALVYNDHICLIYVVYKNNNSTI